MVVLEAAPELLKAKAKSAPRISVILPVYNQGDHIFRVATEYREILAQSLSESFEIILTVNGSNDDSAEECARAAALFPEVQALDCSTTGWGAAIKAGIQASRGQLICFTSSARTSSDVLLKFVKQSLDMPEVVIHARRASQDNWFRSLGSRLFNLQCKVLFGTRAADINGTPKIFPRNFSRLLDLTRDDFSLDIEFDYLCARENYPILEIPVGDTPRHGGQSTTTVMRAVGLLWKTLTLRLETVMPLSGSRS